MPNITISLSLPNALVKLIDEVKKKRQDPTRSDTVRVLLLLALGKMSYLSDDQMKALGMKRR